MELARFHSGHHGSAQRSSILLKCLSPPHLPALPSSALPLHSQIYAAPRHHSSLLHCPARWDPSPRYFLLRHLRYSWHHSLVRHSLQPMSLWSYPSHSLYLATCLHSYSRLWRWLQLWLVHLRLSIRGLWFRSSSFLCWFQRRCERSISQLRPY